MAKKACTLPPSSGHLNICSLDSSIGYCETDADCDYELICDSRDKKCHPICKGYDGCCGKKSRMTYSLIDGVTEKVQTFADGYKCTIGEGDCDRDSDCASGLECDDSCYGVFFDKGDSPDNCCSKK